MNTESAARRPRRRPTNMPAITRAAIYCRVSTDKQERDGFGLDYQERQCRAFAERKGWRVVEQHVYREAHTGMDLDERPKLNAIRKAVTTRAFDVVVAYNMD